MSALAGYGSVLKLTCGVCGACFEGATKGPTERRTLFDSWNEAHAECRAKALEMLSKPLIVPGLEMAVGTPLEKTE